MLKKSTDNQDIVKYYSYPFVGIEDANYQYYLVELLRSLEPRFFKQREIIYDEQEEVQEMYFI